MEPKWEDLKDKCQQLSAEIDRQLRKGGDEMKELRDTQRYLADRYEVLLLVGGEH